MKEAIIHSSDVFYQANGERWKELNEKYLCEAVEMESFALFANAKYLKKKAACLLTISDSFITHVEISAEERQNNLNNMIKIALNLAKN